MTEESHVFVTGRKGRILRCVYVMKIFRSSLSRNLSTITIHEKIGVANLQLFDNLGNQLRNKRRKPRNPVTSRFARTGNRQIRLERVKTLPCFVLIMGKTSKLLPWTNLFFSFRVIFNQPPGLCQRLLRFLKKIFKSYSKTYRCILLEGFIPSSLEPSTDYWTSKSQIFQWYDDFT